MNIGICQNTTYVTLLLPQEFLGAMDRTSALLSLSSFKSFDVLIVFLVLCGRREAQHCVFTQYSLSYLLSLV